MTLDEALLRQLVGLRSLVFDVLFGAVWLVTQFDAVWVAIAALSLRRGRRGWWPAASVGLGLLFAWVVVDEVLKPAVDRPRPFLVLPDVTAHLVPAPTSQSFPSGDVAGAFAAAVAFTAYRAWARGWLFGLAALVAIERVYFGLHWPSDVLAGALVGAVAGRLGVELVRWARTRLPWRAIVVPHTHWDREWYETLAGYRPRLLAAVDGIVAELERRGGVDRFTLDGQTIALEDYLGDRPEMRDRVDALVRAGRLLVGPWYVLSDLILVHAESTVRNLEEGLRLAQSHGRAMRVAYVADPFGHPAQMPQILRGFGYTSYVFARGMGDEGEDLGSEFDWEAPSGDRVLAVHLSGQYDNALSLVRDSDRPEVVETDLPRRVRRELPRLLARVTPYARGDALLLMVGTDHAPITPELLPALEEARRLRPRLAARVGTLEDAVELLQPLALQAHAGELVSGRYSPILRGVNSTRMWIKQENAACERLLLRWLEPFGALLGIYTREDLRPLWRTLLQNHPHDSICGCSIDAVHEVDMRARFVRVRDGGETLRRALLERGGGPALAWSSCAFARTAVVEHLGRRHFVRFAGLGAATLEGETPDAPVTSPRDGVLENGLLRVEVATDGSFWLEGPGGRTGPHNVLRDEGDRGDEYTFSYAGPPVRSAGVPGERVTSADGLRGEVAVRLTLEAPRSLRPDRRARDESRVRLAVETVVRLDAEADRVEVRTTIENVARDHRLRALFATGRATRTHVAGEQFAWLRRPNRVPRRPGWREPPPDTAHAQDFVAVADPVGGLAVAGDGLPEYAILADGREIALTLLRCVGYLSRGDLAERTGHAGPGLETPAAQMQGTFVASYCVVPLASDTDLARAARSVRAFREQPLAAGHGEGQLLFSLESGGAVELSALRAGPRPGTLALRLVNPSPRASAARLHFALAARPLRSTDLREGEDDLGATGLAVLRAARPLEVLPDGVLEARLEPYEIGTWLLAGGMTAG